MKLSTLLLSLLCTLFLGSFSVSAQEASCLENECFFSGAEVCGNGRCSPLGGECGNDGTCIDGFGGTTECDEPKEKDNCDPGFFCGQASGACVEKTCTNLQKENCPASLPKGVCNADGSSGCPGIESFHCSLTSIHTQTLCKEISTSSSSTSSTTTRASGGTTPATGSFVLGATIVMVLSITLVD